MYAIVSVWSMDPAHREEQDRVLHELIVPSVQDHPGFVAGYWMRDPHSGKGHSTTVLADERSAQAFKQMVLGDLQNQARVGISTDSLAVVEILAQAHR